SPVRSPRFTLSLHDALPILPGDANRDHRVCAELLELGAGAFDRIRSEHAASGHRAPGRTNQGDEKRRDDAAGLATVPVNDGLERDRKSTRLNSSHVAISYAV